MKIAKIIVSFLFAIVVSSCATQKELPKSVEKSKARYDLLSKNMTKSVAHIGKPLKTLNKQQQAAVAMLLVMTRVATQNEGIKAINNKAFTEGFWVELPEVCPPLPQDLGSKLPGCFAVESAYAESMASCMNSKCQKYEPDPDKCDQIKDKYESMCEKEHAGKLSAAVQCRMEEIENMRGVLERIPGHRLPPGPFPWPILEGRTIPR